MATRKKYSTVCVICNKPLRPKQSKFCSRECHHQYKRLGNARPSKEVYAERFWKRVRENNGCWEWQGSIQPNGYGAVSYQGVSRYAHRVAYEITYGTIPDGMFVCHHCDNRKCVRLDHLFLGTNADNMRDMSQKGRARPPVALKGEACPTSKLTEAQVHAIRSERINGATWMELVRKYNVGRTTVKRVVKRLSWAHI